jgi:hypothetical protein
LTHLNQQTSRVPALPVTILAVKVGTHLSKAGVIVRSRLADMAQEIFPLDQQTPEALGAFQKAEIEKWWPIIKAAGIKGE